MNLRDYKETGLPDLWSLPKRLTIVISTKDYSKNGDSVHDDDEFEEVLGLVCHSLSSCQTLESKIKPLPMELQGTELESFADQMLAKLKQCRTQIAASCDELVKSNLVLCGWPPSFASPSDHPPTPNFWTVLISENQTAFSKLESSLIRLTRLQQAIDGRTLNGQVLWFIKHLVMPLEDRLKLHFATESATSDISKPDWLFQTALKIIQRHSMGMQYFQGVLKSCGLDGLFDLEIEFMRAIQLTVQSIVANFHLPRLFSSGSGALWITWTESAKKFDRDVMELIGITPEAGELWDQYLETGSIRVFFTNKDWLVAWCNSEVEDCVQQLDEILLRPYAWNSASNGDAFLEEIWPPRFAEEAWGVLVAIVQKTKGIPADCVEIWLKRVGKPYLLDFGRRLSSTAKTTEAFKDLLESDKASRICGVICAANFFIHSLMEWNEFENGVNVNRDQLNHVFSKELNSFSSFRKEWCMKLAKEIAFQFNNDLHDYKKSLHVFSKLGMQDHQPSDNFVPAVLKLRDVLQMFAGLVDAVCFREIWKAVTYGIVRIMFNDVITEAKFSAWGAQQLQCDIRALIDVFSLYTNRPHTHFKELHEACVLLTIPKENVEYIKQSLEMDVNDQDIQNYLRQFGVSVLESDQVLCIIEERVNF
eukprot:g5092.t1